MELDEFKTHWNSIQQQEFQQQKLSTEKLEEIIMTTTETVSQLHSKSVFWRKTGVPIIQVLIVTLTVVLLIIIGQAIYRHKLDGVFEAMAYLSVMGIFCAVSIWMYKKQEQIFTIYINENIRATLTHTITAFKRFYVLINVIYLFLYPAYYYAVIKLLIPYWHTTQQTIFIACAVASVLSLAGGHWYYKAKFFKKIKSLELNLKELEG